MRLFLVARDGGGVAHGSLHHGGADARAREGGRRLGVEVDPLLVVQDLASQLTHLPALFLQLHHQLGLEGAQVYQLVVLFMSD